jgi:hypothetical protein
VTTPEDDKAQANGDSIPVFISPGEQVGIMVSKQEWDDLHHQLESYQILMMAIVRKLDDSVIISSRELEAIPRGVLSCSADPKDGSTIISFQPAEETTVDTGSSSDTDPTGLREE